MKQDIPRVVVPDEIMNDDWELKLPDMQLAVQMVKGLDGLSANDLIIITIQQYDEELRILSDGSVCVRYWVVDDVLHCTPVYANSELYELLDPKEYYELKEM